MVNALLFAPSPVIYCPSLTQSYQEVAVYLPFPSQLVELVLEYLYSDGIDAVQSVFIASVMLAYCSEPENGVMPLLNPLHSLSHCC